MWQAFYWQGPIPPNFFMGEVCPGPPVPPPLNVWSNWLWIDNTWMRREWIAWVNLYTYKLMGLVQSSSLYLLLFIRGVTGCHSRQSCTDFNSFNACTRNISSILIIPHISPLNLPHATHHSVQLLPCGVEHFHNQAIIWLLHLHPK